MERADIVRIGNDEALREGALDVAVSVLEPFCDPGWTASLADGLRGYVRERSDWDLSFAAVSGDRVVGCVVHRRAAIGTVLADGGGSLDGGLSDFDGSEAVELVALAVSPEWRGAGIGRELRATSETLGFGAMFALHLESLGNLEHWARRHDVLGKVGTCWVTGRRFPSPEPSLAAPGP